MKPKTSIVHNLLTARSCYACLQLLIALVLLGWCAAAGAAQTDNWTGLGADFNWTTTANWDQPGGVTTGGDDLIFPVSSKLGSTNDFTGLTVNTITFSTNGYILGGNDLIINNGITDNSGSNSCNLLLRLGGSQTFQNNASAGTTIGGRIDLGTYNLTIGGSGYVYLNGIVSNVVSGGTLTVNNSGVARLGPSTGSTGNTFGTNTADAVIVSSGTLQLFGSAGAGIIPNGPGVGNVQVNGTLDLNGISPTVNGLEGSGTVDSVTNVAAVTFTVGNGDSNAVFSGIIQNGLGTVGLTKTGYGTQTLNGPNSYSGPTTISQGTLLVGTGGSLGTSSHVLTIESGAVLDVTNSGAFGYQPQLALDVVAGTPAKPYTNFWGSYNTNFPTYVIQYDVTNSYVVTNPGPVYITNYYNPSNSIVSIINSDINGNFNVWGGSISPVSDIAPGIATWSIKGNLTLDTSLGLGVPYNLNRVNFVLNNTTTPGGATNDLIAVNGTCYIGDELDFVVSPLTGTLAGGQYTLITSTNLVLTSPNDANPANLVLIAPRGITGTFDTSDNKNVKLTASGTATPGSLVWAGTGAINSWDTHVTKDWTNSGSLDWFYSQDNVVFDDTGIGTITLSIPVAPGSVTFNNNRTNYTFTASTTAWISGTGGLTLNGNGTVTLNNPNNFTGNITLNNGTLILGSYGGYDNVMLYNGVAPGQLIFGAGNGIFQDNWNLPNTSVNTMLSGITLNSGANGQLATLGTRGANQTPRVFIGGNIVRNVGSSLYIPFGTRAGSVEGVYFTNTIPWVNGLIGGGWMHVGNDWFLAVTNFSTVAPANYNYTAYATGSTLANWASTNNVALTNTTFALTGSSNIYTLKLLGPVTLNQTAGTTLTILSGGLLVSSASTGANTIQGGTLEGAAGQDLIVLQNYTAPLTIGSVIADNGSATALTLGGTGGTLILTNNNTYTGATYINNGTLQVGAGAALGSIATSSGILDNGNLSFNRPDSTSVGAVSGKGGVTQAGTGTLVMTADNTFSGPVTNSGGTLQIGNGSAVGSISNAASVLNNGTLVFNNSGTVGCPNVISGSGRLVQQSAGTLVLTAAETYTGNTIVSNGILKLAASGSISNTAGILINSGATFDVSALSGGFVMRTVAPNEIIAGNGTINGSLISTNGGRITPGTNGVIGTLAVSGNLTMNGGNYYFDVGTSSRDQITVGGILNQGQANFFINPTTTLTNGLYPLVTATGGISGSTANLIAIGFAQAGQLAVLTNSTANELDLLVYSGIAPTVTWVGDGSQNLWDESGNSHWTPGSYQNNDQVVFDDTGSASPAVNMDVVVYPSTVTVNSTSKNYTFAGSSGGKISGGASLFKPSTSTSTLTLETLNDYSGVTAINGGVVQLGDGASAANDGMVGIAGNVTNNATLIATNVGAETLSGNLVGTGTLIQGGAGTLILAGNNGSFSGPIIIPTNSLQVGNGVSGTLGTGNVTDNGSLLFNVGGTVPVNANIAGTGPITNLGGTVTLNGTNSYAGVTAVAGGTVIMGSDSAIPGGTVLTMNDNSSPNPVGTLDLNGHDLNVSVLQGANTGIGTAAFEAARILNNGSGTNVLTVSGGGTYTFYGQMLDNNNAGSGRLGFFVTGNTFLNLYPGYTTTAPGTAFANTFSGGMIISNATVHFGNGGQATDRNNGQNAAGLGMITLCGGLGTATNSLTGFPTNGIILPAQYGSSYNSARSEYNTYPTIYIPAGQVGSIFLDGYGGLNFPLIGSGTLTIQPSYVRDQVSGDWTAFTGTIIFQLITTGYGTSQGGFTITSALGLPNATLVMHTNNLAFVNVSGGTAGSTLPVGALTGGDNTSALGGGTQGNGSSGGARNTIWAIGSLNLSTTNGSQFLDGGCGIRKVGTGSLTLTNNTLSFGGQCVVSNGTLIPAPAADFIATIATNNYLAGTNITVVAPGILDVSQMGGTLYIGGHTGTTGGNSQTLYGSGTVNGNLLVTNSIVAPAYRASMGTNVFTGSGLTVSGSVAIKTGSTVIMSINRTNSPAYDSLNAASIVYGGALVVTNLGDTAFPGASSNVFKLFNITGNTISGSFTSITLPALPVNEYWVSNNLAVDGTIALVNTSAPSINTNPPAMMFSLAGAQLSLGWPTNAGWILQSQTNSLSAGLTPPSNTWFDVAGSASITNTVITVNPTNPTVFYRLRLP